MRKKLFTSKIILLMACAALSFAIVGVGAYYFQTHSMDNKLDTAKPKVYMNEKFDPTDKWVPGEEKEKEVKFGNEGSMDCYLRAQFTPKLTLKDGTEITDADIPDGFVLNFASGFSNEWTSGSDGWYYYKELLPQGAKTPLTLESVTISSDIGNDVHGIEIDYSGATFSVDIDSEFIQSENASDAAAENRWAIDPTKL